MMTEEEQPETVEDHELKDGDTEGEFNHLYATVQDPPINALECDGAMDVNGLLLALYGIDFEAMQADSAWKALPKEPWTKDGIRGKVWEYQPILGPPVPPTRWERFRRRLPNLRRKWEDFRSWLSLKIYDWSREVY